MTDGLPWGPGGGPTAPAPASPPPEGSGRRAARYATIGADESAPEASPEPPGDVPVESPTREWSSSEWTAAIAAPVPSAPERPAPVYARRRDMREARPAPEPEAAFPTFGFAPPSSPPPGGPAGRTASGPAASAPVPVTPTSITPVSLPVAAPGTARVERYQPWPGQDRGLSPAVPLAEPPFGAEPGSRGEAVREGVERWSRWAAGLGKPPRDPRGQRRYPGLERLFPPAVWVAAMVGAGALAGLLLGLLLAAGQSRGAVTVQAVATMTTTATVETTLPAVTVTKTKTVTQSPTEQAGQPTGQDGQPAGQDGQGQTLAPGSQGPLVFALQQQLQRVGVFQGQLSGVYDEPTRAAVQNFQSRNNITADPQGVAGPTTLQVLAEQARR